MDQFTSFISVVDMNVYIKCCNMGKLWNYWKRANTRTNWVSQRKAPSVVPTATQVKWVDFVTCIWQYGAVGSLVQWSIQGSSKAIYFFKWRI